MGRKRKTIKELKRDGRYVPSRHANRQSVTLTPGRPRMPSWLGPEAKTCWRELVPQLIASKRLCVEDGPALSGLCSWWGEWIQAAAAARAADDPKAVATHRAMAVAAWRECFAMMKRFGLTPADRVAIGSPTAEGPSKAAVKFFNPESNE